MASPQQHLAQWKHNRLFIASIGAQFPDWRIAVCFYIALHAVDTLLTTDDQEPQSHRSRNETLMNVKRYEQLWKHYRPLYEQSRVVRYLADPNQWLQPQLIETQIISRYLYPIEKSVCKLCGLKDEFPPIQLQA